MIKNGKTLLRNGLFALMVLCSVSNAQVTQEWVAVYDGPSGSIDSVRNLAVDDFGNVYVTGSSTSSTLFDYTTLKYSSDGVLQWEARYDGPAHFRDDAQWLALDHVGNVYVTGSSRSGVQAGTEDFATVKYNSDGVQQWSMRYNGPAGSTDVAAKVAVDASGNVYVTGYSYGTMIDYATIKYNADGVQQWVAVYNGPGNSLDAPTALAVDVSGNVFVTGWSRSTALYGSEDYLTIKYNGAGVEQWVARYNGPSNMIDQAKSLAIDNAGNSYVTGYRLSPSTQADYVTIKYNQDGVQQWISAYNNASFNGSDIARMVVVDNSQNVYVTGTSGTAYPLGYPNYVTIKYDASGAQQWVSAYNGPGNGEDAPSSLALDGFGDVYVTGKATMPGFVYDVATVKYNAEGNQIWEERFNGGGDLQDGGTWVGVDNLGNVFVSGNSMYNTNFASDFVVIKYTQSGAGGGIPCDDIFFFNAKCNANGAAQAMVKISGDHAGEAVAFDLDGSPQVVTLQSNGTNSIGKMTVPHAGMGSHTVTLMDPASCYAPVTFNCQVDAPADAAWDALWAENETLEQIRSDVPDEVRIIGNYPNPFNPTTSISYAINVDGFVSLKIYSSLGEEVTGLVNEFQTAGYKSVTWNGRNDAGSIVASGLYFYRLTAGSVVLTEKMMFMK